MAETVEIVIKATDKASPVLNKASGAFGKFKGAIGTGLATAAGVGLVGVTALGVGLTKSVMQAGDATESLAKFETVFGDFAGGTAKQLDEFAAATGRSKFALKEMASSVQDTFVPLGFARGEAADLSLQLTQLAVDVGSFNNVAETDVMADFQSALVGNTETVRKYGIIITQATLDQELMNMGIADGVKGATEQQKVQARLNLIMKGTTDAQGDAVKTAGSFANQMKALNAIVTDTSTEIGMKLLPVITPLIQQIADLAKEYGPQLVAVIGQWVQSFIDFIPQAIEMWEQIKEIGLQVWDVIKPVVEAVGQFLGWQEVLIAVGGIIAAVVIPAIVSFVAAAWPVVLAIGAIIAIVVAVKAAWETNFLGIRDITFAVIEWIKANVLPTFWAIVAFVQENWPVVQQVITDVMNAIGAVIQQVTGAIGQWWEEHGNSVLTIAKAVWNGIKAVIETNILVAKAIIFAIATAIQKFWDTWGDTILALAKLYWDQIKVFIETTMNIISFIIDAIAAIIEGDWDSFKQALVAIARTAWEGIKTLINNAVNFVWDNILAPWITKIKQNWDSFLTTIKDKWKKAWDAIKEKVENIIEPIKTAIDNIKSAVKGVITAVEDVVSALPGKLSQIVSAFTGIKDSIVGVFIGEGSIGAAIQNVLSWLGSLLSKLQEAENAPKPSADLKVASVVAGGNGETITPSRTVTNNYILNYNGQAPGNVVQDFNLLKATLSARGI